MIGPRGNYRMLGGECRGMFMNAQEAIGANDPAHDWILRPEEHEQSLPPEAGPLKRILRSARVQALIRDYRKHDEAAQKARTRYMRLGKLLAVTSAAAILLGGLYLLTDVNGHEWVEHFRLSLLVLEGIAFALLLALAIWMRSGGDFENWTAERGWAEARRLNLFQTVCGLTGMPQQEEAREGELPLLPLQLEYFRRYLLGVEMNYYRGRAAQHGKAARSQAAVLASLLFLGALVLAFSNSPALQSMLEATGMEMDEVLAFFGLALPVIYQAQESVKLISGDQRSALRYRKTHENLDQLAQRLDMVRARAAEGDREAFHEFAEAVIDNISVEHMEWRSLAGDTAVAAVI